MLIPIIGRLVPLVKHFIEALKDHKLSPEELEALALETGLAIAAILKDLGLGKKD